MPCSRAPFTAASIALRRCSASASGVAGRRSPWWVSTQCARASRRGSSSGAGALVEQAQPELDVAEQPALVGEADLGAERELARLAEVVDDRRRQQQVLVQARVQRAGLQGQRRHRDGVLEQPAEVGVVAGARARRAAQRRAQRPVAEEVGEQRREGRIAHLARPGARGSRRARRGRGRRRAGRPRGRRRRRGRSRAARAAARRGSARRARRRARGRPARSARRADRRRGRRARGWRRCGRAARARGTACPVRAVRRSLRVQANTPLTSSPGRIVATAARRCRNGVELCRRHEPMMYREPDAAPHLGASPRRLAGARARVRVHGVERCRRRRIGRAAVPRLVAGRHALRAHRPRGLLRLPGHAAEDQAHRRAARAASSGPRSRSTRRASRAPRATSCCCRAPSPRCAGARSAS